MMYLILLTVLLPLVLGVYLYFGKIENRNLKNVIIASIVGVVAVINILLTFFYQYLVASKPGYSIMLSS